MSNPTLQEKVLESKLWLKDEFRHDVDAYGRPKALMSKIDKAFDNINTALKESEESNQQMKDVVKAVAHIGIDWGYGKYELEDKHIDAARALYEADTALQNPTLTPPKGE